MTDSQEELEKEHDNFIKESVEDGRYFKDAMEWYSLSYILPYAERGFYIILFILSVFITYLFFSIISATLPLEQSVPIFLTEKDSTAYVPKIKSLANKEEAKTTEEAVLRFIVINYLKEREEHNYKTANINDVNIKLDKIKNNSSIGVFEEFKEFMSKSNPSSPIHFFGKNISRNIKVKSFKFNEIEKLTIMDRIRGFLAIESLPTKAYIDYTVNTILPNRVVSEKKRVEIVFKFNGIKLDRKTKEFLPLRFIVVDYKKFNK
jgi:type IV secretion system protein VirB8